MAPGNENIFGVGYLYKRIRVPRNPKEVDYKGREISYALMSTALFVRPKPTQSQPLESDYAHILYHKFKNH